MGIFEVEKAILVGVNCQNLHPLPLEESMGELARLADTAGAKVVAELTQNRPAPDAKYFIGSGKLDEIKALIASYAANLIIFDNELSASQGRNLEEELGVKVIDRTELILDIFAQHAKSREGRLQIELAQDMFMLTRLTGHGASMSRLGGGIATRGPGETKLEYDRRNIRKRISQLKKEIEKISMERSIQREKRRKTKISTVVLVGYTNAGKSTLLNALTKSDVLTQDKLFATLDPTIRRLYLPGGKTVLVTDTVGFIQKLPHQLIDAFRATLEEVIEADLLIHVVDASHAYFEDQISSVYKVLDELNCAGKTILTVFNKMDKLDKKIPADLLQKYSPALAVSALKKGGLEQLESVMDSCLRNA